MKDEETQTTDDSPQLKESESTPPKKQAYSKPELKEYGAIERHTGGGSGSNVEGSMSMSSKRRIG